MAQACGNNVGSSLPKNLDAPKSLGRLCVLDLFSGIGGFSLGLERAGMQTVAFCEIDPFCRRVLAKHWPKVPIYDDIRSLTGERLAADGIAADVICGGFPCQDISVAGKGAGIEGERSGLWSEYARIIGELRPRYIIVENVAAILGRGLDRVLGDLAALGFDAEWHCIPASAVGAPHRRDRLWLVAHGNGSECEALNGQPIGNGSSAPRCGGAAHDGSFVADAFSTGLEGRAIFGSYLAVELATAQRGGEVSDTASQGRNGARSKRSAAEDRARPFREPSRPDWWRTEPDVGRVAHGVPARVDRLRSLGNAVVPQIPEIIGRAILQAEAA